MSDQRSLRLLKFHPKAAPPSVSAGVPHVTTYAGKLAALAQWCPHGLRILEGAIDDLYDKYVVERGNGA
jgi:hypothetical protein